MRKNKDYSDIENALFDKANKIESGVNYSGAYRDSKNEKRVKREKSGRGFDFPGRQLVAALLAMVIVGAGTFAGLKTLERIGAKRLAEQGGAPGTSQGEQIAENVFDTDHNRSGADDISGVETIEYDPGKENGEGLVYVTSGDKVYQPFICEQNRMALIDYLTPTFNYCGKMNIVNNVKDRDWTVLSTNIWFPGIQSYDRTFADMDLKMICSWIDRHESGTYRVTFKVTWDDPDDENAKIYYVDFCVEKSTESAVFEDVVKFDIDYSSGEPIDYDVLSGVSSDIPALRLMQRVKCEAAEALGYSICLYDAAPLEFSSIHLAACILDENGELMFEIMQNTDVWYAGKTPTCHPTFFCVKRHALTSNGWTYADLYAYDTVNKEETLVISVGPEGLHSQSNLRVYGDISYDDATKELKISFYEDKTNIWNPEDKATWPEPFATEQIKWDGGRYVVEGIDAGRLSEESANAYKTEEEIKREQLKAKTEEEANSRLYVTASGAEYYPALINAEIFEDHKVYQFEYKNDLPVIEYSEPFEVKNRIRTLWTIHGIDAGNAGFADIDGLTDYLHKVSGSVYKVTYLEVNISVSWNNDNIYHYGFTLKFKANDVTQKTDVTPSGYAKFAVIVGKYAIAPYEYKEYDKSEVNEVNVTVNPAPDVIPVIDVYALGEYEIIKYSYDTEAVTHVETRMGAYSGGTVLYSSPGSILTDARSMLRIPGASNVLYVESVFQKKDGSGKYISYIFAVSGGDPACYPFSSDGDGAAHFTVSDDNDTYAPRAKYFYCSDRSVIENSRFTELNLQYYNVPTVVLTGSLEFRMKDGYHISKVIAFKDTKATEQNVYNGIEGLHLSTWLSKQPWGEFYAAVIVDKDGEESDEGNGNLTAYVFRVVLASPSSNPETVEQIQTVDHSAQIEELQSWLSQRMWYGMTTDDLVTHIGSLSDNGISFKTRFLADDHSQLNVKEDYTFVAYRSEHYDIIFISSHDGPPYALLEARVIMKPGAEFDLPFGITLDMSPEQALSALGYTEEQITAMDGYASSGAYELRYNDRNLIITYQCNGACLGIELGSDPQMYIETAE